MIPIALTGYGRWEDRDATRQAGYDAHRVKPLKPDELSRLLFAWSHDPSFLAPRVAAD